MAAPLSPPLSPRDRLIAAASWLFQGAPNAEVDPSMRLILVGPTRAGKSQTGNCLLRPIPPPPPTRFKVSGGVVSQTAEIKVLRSRDHGWDVVDTPGLGDLPGRNPNETVESYLVRCNDRSTGFFNDITAFLREKGGRVLFVQGHGALTPVQERHLKALGMVVGVSFNTGVLLVKTCVPDDCQFLDGDTDREKKARQLNYLKWLADAKDRTERQTGLKFAGVLGICDNRALSKDHLAHPCHFVQCLEQEDLKAMFVPPGATTLWKDVIDPHYQEARHLDKLHAEISNMERLLNEEERKRQHYLLQIQRSGHVVVVGTTLAPVLGPAGAFLGLPLGAGSFIAVLLCGGAVLAKELYTAAIKVSEKKSAELREAERNLESELAAVRGGKGERAFQGRANNIKALVYPN